MKMVTKRNGFLIDFIAVAAILLGAAGGDALASNTDPSTDRSGWRCVEAPLTTNALFTGGPLVRLDSATLRQMPSMMPQAELATFDVPRATPRSAAITSVPAAAGETGALIAQTARSLMYNPARIYEFVRNHIAFVPYFGVLRGPERTLIDRAGNDADQALLLGKLLQASGYPVNYVFAAAAIPMSDPAGYDLPHWLGTEGSNAVFQTLANAGYTWITPNYPLVGVSHFWALTQINGATYQLDPSFKPSVAVGTLRLNSDTNLFLTAAGGTATSDYVQNMNRGAVERFMRDAAAIYIRPFLETNYPNKHVWEAIWFRRLHPLDFNALQTNMVNFIGWYGTPQVLGNLTNYTALRHTLQVNCGTISNTFWLDEIAARKLWLNYGGTPLRAQLWLDDQLIASDTSGSTAATDTLQVTITHPYPSGFANDSNTYTLRRGANNVYALPVGFGGDQSGRMKAHALRQVEKLTGTGLAQTDPKVLSANLQVIGQAWLQTVDAFGAIIEALTGQGHVFHHQVGLMAQEAGYYIDVKNILWTQKGLYSGNVTKMLAFQFSALEHVVLEQLTGTNVPAVSTVRLLTQANDQGQKIFRVNAANWAAVQGQLVNYDLAAFGAAVNQGKTFLLPQNGRQTLGQWSGQAYMVYHGGAVGAMIGGGLNGGYISSGGTVNTVHVATANYAVDKTPAQTQRNFGKDPVDLYSGAFVSDATDLTLDGPLELAFTRHYDSRRSNSKSALGWGWRNGYDIRAVVHSDAIAGMGGRALLDMSSVLAASVYLRDLIALGDGARNEMAAALIANWLGKQLTDNAVSITLGQKVLTFIRQADGVYIPPPGVTMSLTGTPGAFVLQERLGKTYTFNANNSISRITDPDGNTLTFAYNAQTNLQSVVSSFGPSLTLNYTGDLLTSVDDNAGRTVTYQYTSNNLTAYVDPEGYAWNLTYDGHRITALTDPEGITTIQNRYNVLDQVTNQISATGQSWNLFACDVLGSEVDPAGRPTTYLYDEQGRTILRNTPDGAIWKTVYDGQNHPIATLAPNGVLDIFTYDRWHNLRCVTNAANTTAPRVTAYGYDNLFRMVALTNALGKVTTYQYNATHHPTLIRDPLGTETVFTYTPQGLVENKSVRSGGQTLTSVTTTYQTGLPWRVTATDAGTVTYLRNGYGDITQITDARDKITRYTYDKRRLLTSSVNPLNQTTSQTYYRNGLLKTTTDPRSATTTERWTPAYKKQATVLPNGGVVSNTYDSADRLTALRDARGSLTTLKLDAVGRVTNSISALKNEKYFYDLMGNRRQVIDTLGATTLWGHDQFNRPVVVRDPLVRDTWTGYDPLDHVTSITNARGKIWATAYDAAGRPTLSTRPSGAVEQKGLDGLGRLIAFTNADGRVMNLAYDRQGHLTAFTDATGQQTRYGYDLAGNRTGRWDAARGWTRFAYDDANRLIATAYPDGATATLGYDANGNLTAGSNQQSAIRFAYNAMNHLTNAITQIGAVNFAVRYGRDLGGNITSITYPGNRTITRGYNAENMLTNITDWAGRTIALERDANGRLTGLRYPNGVTGARSYNLAGELTGYSYAKGGTFIARRLIRNELGFKTKEEIDSGLAPIAPTNTYWQHTHDAANRITASRGTENGRPIAQSYAYDAAGNLLGQLKTSTANPAAARTNAYAYDAANRLLSASSSSSVSSVVNSSFAYDALGNRISVSSSSATSVSSVVTSSSLYALDYADALKRPLVELDAAGNIVRSFIWGDNLLLAIIEANGAVRYLHADEQSSVIALTDAAGAVTDEFAYGPYGEPWRRNGSTPLPFRWLGGYGVLALADSAPASALAPIYLTHHRAYDASLARFLQTDPLGIDGGVNLYAYANLNPLAFVDPYGLCAESFGSQAMNWTQNALDVVGMAYPPADLLNAGISGLRGDKIGAVASLAAVFSPVPSAATKGAFRSIDAAKSGDGLVDLASSARRTHILDGEVRANGSFGGGHRPGTGYPGKSEFPAGWSDDQIMHHISDVATDPLSTVRPGRGSDIFVQGSREGVDIEVLMRNNDIWTGYPTSVPRNPR